LEDLRMERMAETMIDDCAACTSMWITFCLVGCVGVDENEHT